MDRFLVEKLERRIQEVGRSVYLGSLSVSPVRWSTQWVEGATSPDYDDSAWQLVSEPYRWGGRRVRCSFRCRFEVPADWRGGSVALRIELARGMHVSGPDGTVYLDGLAWQGVDVYHQEVRLPERYQSGQHTLVVEAYSGTEPDSQEFGGVRLVLIDEQARGLYYDAKTALDAALLLEETSYERVAILNALDEAILQVDFREPLAAAYRASLPAARRVLAERLYEREWGNERPEVIGTGHAHIDVAWLWTLLHTRKKTGRTFLTALRLMEQYPEYHFTQSQPQVYDFFRHDYPEWYAEVKRRISEGRWEATGGMWLEADSNISGGESLVRQIMFGKRFFRREFGVEDKVLWLPDAFGYTWALPQIMARSGLKYFMTTKISWSEYNRMPHDTFRWQGIDGTQVLTHFINTPHSRIATYNGSVTPAEIKGTWDSYRDKDVNSRLLTAFGIGDGGGGPSADMLERGRRLANLPGMPRFRQGSATAYFESLEPLWPKLPVWNDELYLEYHRGVFTSQARNKRYNRRSEIAYHNAEALCSIASLFGAQYPSAPLAAGWEKILLNQFHDILPGSSIGEVYEESHRQYEQVLATAAEAQQGAMAALAARMDTGEGALIVFNTLGWQRSGLLRATLPPDVSPLDDQGKALVTQPLPDGSTLVEVEVPAYGWCRLALGTAAGATATASLRAEPHLLESPYLRVSFDNCGRIVSLVDKMAQREVLEEGRPGNQFVLFEDKPLANDAWDINLFYQEKSWPITGEARMRVIERGPLRAGIEVCHEFLHSRLCQRIYVYAGSPRLDFETSIDWHEHHLLLKVAFPVAVHSRRATYEIQFGAIDRPTHWNTSWDLARFEVPAQRWADLSEADYGVSLLNDCKYGYDIHDNVMRLTLIKSATSPDPEADQGEHQFTYSVLPHKGDWRRETLRQAADLNVPLLAVVEPGHSGTLPGRWSLVQSSAENIIIETVKKAEDSDDLVVRVYESQGRRGRATLNFPSDIAAASECNLMEEEEQPVAFAGRELGFDYRPFQIRTFKLSLR